VLLKCLRHPTLSGVSTIGRTASGIDGAALRKLHRSDREDHARINTDLSGFEACFFCLGGHSSELKEREYAGISRGFPLAAGALLSRFHPGMTFLDISGSGSVTSEKGRSIWAPVKSRTENALLPLPLSATLFRPGFIRPMAASGGRLPPIASFIECWGLSWRCSAERCPNQVLRTRKLRAGDAFRGAATLRQPDPRSRRHPRRCEPRRTPARRFRISPLSGCVPGDLPAVRQAVRQRTPSW
jgi:hypothetical protein